ncbi:LysR family transcriptional regulator [Litorimonas haliclonae]|uniref:LysR family transcriptional regulator n=1 Tax=Litorimonas haliclonae TaxID=2081977 RepID=UPI0039EF9FEC
MSRYEEIEAFVRTIEAGSFTQAAKQLGLSKSAISRRLSDLEDRLGTQLVQRTTRSLSLTEAGDSLFQRGVGLLADWNEAEADAASENCALAGRIRLAAPLSFGVQYLGPAILDFLELHPDVDFDIDFSDRQIDLISEGVDVAIRIGELNDSTMVARKLAPVEMLAVASPAYLEKQGYPNRPKDLIGFNELRYSNKTRKSWAYSGPNGETGEVEIPSSLRANNGTFLTEAAIAGQGITISPSFFLCEAVQSGKLEIVLPDYSWAEVTVYAVYPPTRHLSLRVRTWVDFLVERFKGTPPWAIEIN